MELVIVVKVFHCNVCVCLCMRDTAVCGMALHFHACLSRWLCREPVLACCSLSVNTEYHSESLFCPCEAAEVCLLPNGCERQIKI